MSKEFKCKCGAVICHFTDMKKTGVCKCPFCGNKIDLKSKNKEDVVIQECR